MAKLPAMNGGPCPNLEAKAIYCANCSWACKAVLQTLSNQNVVDKHGQYRNCPSEWNHQAPSTDTLTESSISLPFMSTILAIHVNYTGCQNPLSTFSDILSFASRQRPSPPSWLRLEDLWPNARTSFRSCLLPRTFLDVERLREGFAGLTPQQKENANQLSEIKTCENTRHPRWFFEFKKNWTSQKSSRIAPIVNTLQPLRCEAQIPKHAPCWIDGHLDFPVGDGEPRPSKFGKHTCIWHMVILMKWANYTTPQSGICRHCCGTYSIVSYFVLFHETNIGKKSSAALLPSWRSFAGTMIFSLLKKNMPHYGLFLYRASQTCMQSGSSTEPPCERLRDSKTQAHQVQGCGAPRKLLVSWVSHSWGFIST